MSLLAPGMDTLKDESIAVVKCVKNADPVAVSLPLSFPVDLSTDTPSETPLLHRGIEPKRAPKKDVAPTTATLSENYSREPKRVVHDIFHKNEALDIHSDGPDPIDRTDAKHKPDPNLGEDTLLSPKTIFHHHKIGAKE